MNLKQKALSLALGTALISGLAVFFNSFAAKIITNSSVLTTAKNILVALILSLIVLTPLIFTKVKQLTKKDWLNLTLIGLIGGSIPFLLFFKGLTMTSAINAAFIHKTLFIWVTLLAIPFLKEKLSKVQWLALLVLIVGNYFLVGIKNWNFGWADLLILVATLFWAVEFVIAKKVLASIDAKIVAWGRMFFGSIFLILFLLFTNQATNLINLNGQQWLWLAISSTFLCGYVITWYQALAKLPATVVTSVLVVASPITSALSAIFVTHKYSWQQALGSLILLTATMAFIYVFIRREKARTISAK
jgi:drug/metabolite transporter (DMT)-like permease